MSDLFEFCRDEPMRAAREIHRLTAELEERDKQIESLQNKWASRELSQQDSDALMADNARLREALQDLVTLKDYRDWHGKTEDYLEKKPAAWAQAREALKQR